MRFFARLLAALSAVPALCGAEADLAPPVAHVVEVAVPTTANAIGPSLVRSADGETWLTWLEPLSDANTTALRFARFDIERRTWGAPATIARGEGWFNNPADFPAVSLGVGGKATAVWFVNNPAPVASPAHDHHGPGYHAVISQSEDAGKTWTAGTPLSRESDAIEFVSFATLADDRVLAVWLDGRGKKAGEKTQRLYGRVIGSAQPDRLIDASVCDCCQTTLTAFPDGTALVAYRGRSPEEIRDIRVARFRDEAWQEPRVLSRDGWQINGCPANGPQLASDGGRVAAAWFTAADKQPRVLASFSPDAGARFLMPARIDAGQPTGRVDTLILRDGAMLVTWVENDGSLWLRRISPDFSPGDPIRLASVPAGRVKGFPRATLLRDYVGGPATAELLVAFAAEGAQPLRTLHITVPEGAWLDAEKNCDCAPTPEQLRGHPFRGTIAAASTEADRVRVRHPETPGIFAAGSRDLRVTAELREAAAPGRAFFGRVEQRDGEWWLFDVRFVVDATRPK